MLTTKKLPPTRHRYLPIKWRDVWNMPSLSITHKLLDLGDWRVTISRRCSRPSPLFVSAKLELCLGWCNIPASCSDCGYCVFHWKQRRRRSHSEGLISKEKGTVLLLSSVKVFSYQRIMKKSQTVSMYCTEYRYRYKNVAYDQVFYFLIFLCCKPFVCGTVLKCHDMFWSRHRPQNEQGTIFHVTLS